MSEPTFMTLKIKYNPGTFNIHIIGTNFNRTIWSQIVLISNSISNNVNIKSNNELTLPLFEFKEGIIHYSKLIIDNNLKVEYDNTSKRLIGRCVKDTAFLKSIPNHNVLSDYEINQVLSQTNFNRNLRDHQKRDLRKLLSIKHGANFSVPGAGKTTTLLAIYAYLKELRKVDKLFIIAPRNAFISWEDEIIDCFKNPAPEIQRLVGGREKILEILEKSPEVAIISYHQLANIVDDIIKFIQKSDVHLVLDESHRIKRGKKGIHYLASIKTVDYTIRRDILSGTPMPQSTNDLQSQFQFLWPGTHLLDDILTNTDEDEIINEVNCKIKPLYSRTTKDELGLKEPIIHKKKIELSPIQREIYDLMKLETARQLHGLDYTDKNIFRKIGKSVVRLMQVVSNPLLITSKKNEDGQFSIKPGSTLWELLTEFGKSEESAKLDYVKKRTYDLAKRGDKTVIWSFFVNNIKYLEKVLSDLNAVSIYGEIQTGDENDIETREGRIRRFHNDQECMVLIGNPAACGEGISLHKVCHNAIYLDRTFNAAHYLQSIDRIHRLGLPKDISTNVEIVVARNTIDAIIDQRLNKKIDTMSRVLEDFNLQKLTYDPEDTFEEYPGGIDKNDFYEIKKHLME
jgi:SNF2 family DNA or RNA helicase